MLDVLMIDSFCARHDLCWAIQTDDITPIVQGQNGAFIYCFDEGRKLLGLAFSPDDCSQPFSTLRQRMTEACMSVIHYYPVESYLAFELDNPLAAQIALEVLCVERVLDSAAKRERMRDVISRARQWQAGERERRSAETAQFDGWPDASAEYHLSF